MHQWLTRVTCNSWVTLKTERNAPPPLGVAYPTVDPRMSSLHHAPCVFSSLSICYPSLNLSVPGIRFSYKSVPVSVCISVCCCCVIVCVCMCDFCCLYLRGFCSVFIEQHRNNRMGKDYDRLQNSLAEFYNRLSLAPKHPNNPDKNIIVYPPLYIYDHS